MATPRLVVELTIGGEDVTTLMAIARSRTEPASRVERALVLLAYRDDPPSLEWNVSACIIKPCSVVSSEPRPLAHWQRWTTVRGPARRRGSQPRPKHGSCRWPARKRRTLAIRMSCGRRGSWLAMREYGPAAGHECLARLVQETVCKILDAHAIKPLKIRYYLAPRSRIRREDDARPLHLPQGRDFERGQRAKRHGGSHFLR